MNFKITALAAAAALCVVSAVSCGKDAKTSSDVVLDINNGTTASEETSATSENEEKTTTTAVTTKEAKKTTATTSSNKTVTTTAVDTDNKDDEPDENDEPQEDDSPSYDDPQQDEPQNDQPDPEPQGGSYSDSDLNFNGTSLLSNADGLISSLGTPNDILEAPGCLSNGADQKIYQYSGVEVSCYVMNGSEVVYDIMITGSGYSTSKGITVGSSRSDVEAAYGAGSGGSEVIYGSASYGIMIGYSGDTVSWIAIHADV